jgi:2-polyprenyl-3-methyl-5-hydroxy-6-metoxy-1,4-benzoquinol methylase
MARWARQRNLQAELTGVDANGYIADYAAANCRDYPEISFRKEDIFSPAFAQQGYDVMVCSLFCHHFTDEQLVAMFRQMYHQARLGVIINDLHRHPLAYHSIHLLTSLFSKSYLVKNDAKLSVLRAFRKAELRELLAEAGITRYRLKWMWAFRWQLVLLK